MATAALLEKNVASKFLTAAVKSLLMTFFPNNVAVAIATMLDLAGGCLNADEIADLQQKINQARKEEMP
jgi:uncharacterized membrane protein